MNMPLKSHEFYHRYANTPLGDRLVKVDFNGLNMTLNEIYQEMHQIDDFIRPYHIRQEELLREASKVLGDKIEP